MGIARALSLKRQNSVPIFGCQSHSSLRASTKSSSEPSASGSNSTQQTTLNSSASSSQTNSSVNVSNFSGEQQNATKTDRKTWLQRHLDVGFRWTGQFIEREPKRILIIFLLFSAICSIKILFTRQEDDLKSGYTPIGAPSHHELSLYSEFYKGGEPITIVIFVYARDNSSMSRLDHLNETVDLIDQIGNDFKLANLSFYQFCSDFCSANEPIRQFRNSLLISNFSSSPITDHLSDRIKPNYPFMEMLGHRLDLSPNFFGVRKFPPQLSHNSSSNIEFLKLIVLQFRAEKPINSTKYDIEEWERTVANFINKEYKSEKLKTMALTVTLARDEILRTGLTLFPFLSVGFLIMSLFSILTVGLSAFYYGQWTNYKIVVALWACICPLLATSTALGVDDAYLMLHSWQRLAVSNKLSTQHNGLKQRVEEMLVEVGPSITITSATNVLAFTVGIFSPTPEIQLFCAGNAVAIFADYVYQIFVFVPVLIMVGRCEEKQCRNKLNVSKKMLSRRQNIQAKADSFMLQYSDWLSNKFTFVFVLILLIVYWWASLKGMLSLEPKITPKKLFLSDSIINDINKIRDDYILPAYTSISVFVNKVGDLNDPEHLRRIYSLIEEFEKEPQCLGSEFTHFWLRDYDTYIKNSNEEDNQVSSYNREQISDFLSWSEFKHWNGFMRFNKSTGDLETFFAVVAFHGPDMVAWESRGRLLKRWRSIANKYPDLGAFIWVDEAQFLDQIETLIPSTVQSSIATLFCMIFVCLLFMGKNLFTLIIAILSIISICIGVFGFLSFWGIQLDPISMVTIIMSIGFSVDFPSHIAYHHYRLGKESNGQLSSEHRIHKSLVAIGYPLVQCGLSSILFVTCLLFIDTYMSEVFVKTMTLVVSFGLIHALLIIPTMLCTFSHINRHIRKRISMTNINTRLSNKVKDSQLKPTNIMIIKCEADN